ncbi:hypothetical protein Nepgr_020999 [Nepenthes gracilis]|uniref:Uncharacterized protein n=1 Tax=Nepenthes gracilis TaxID=150966 RepID=A0AAD3SW43_NEPGR|nr:hypothetical protein Nepgr_020999 [Nepenthes gracilis]
MSVAAFVLRMVPRRINRPCLQECGKIYASLDAIGVTAMALRYCKERICPDWMNIPASSSHPSPGGHPDRVSTPISSSKIFLNEDEKLNDIFKIGIYQRRVWIGHLQQEVRSLSQNRINAKVLEET